MGSTKRLIKLNCDLGESFGIWRMANDASIMAHVDMANIACGFHGGDPIVMQQAIEQAIDHNVSIGAHPSYPDLQGFGRRSMSIPEHELIPILHYQLAALEGMVKVQGGRLDYVKPHGALYNDMIANLAVFEAIVKGVSKFNATLPIVVQALPNTDELKVIANSHGVSLLYEGFADRRYQSNGRLTPRTQAGAVLSLTQMLEQVESLLQDKCVLSETGDRVSLKIDTLCVHGDTTDALDAVLRIREMLGSRPL